MYISSLCEIIMVLNIFKTDFSHYNTFVIEHHQTPYLQGMLWAQMKKSSLLRNHYKLPTRLGIR